MEDINIIIDEFIKDSNTTALQGAEARGKRIKENFYVIIKQVGVVTDETENINQIIVTTGDGTMFLSNDGTYKTIATGTSGDINVDGGSPTSNYLPSQTIDGGIVEWPV